MNSLHESELPWRSMNELELEKSRGEHNLEISPKMGKDESQVEVEQRQGRSAMSLFHRTLGKKEYESEQNRLQLRSCGGRSRTGRSLPWPGHGLAGQRCCWLTCSRQAGGGAAQALVELTEEENRKGEINEKEELVVQCWAATDSGRRHMGPRGRERCRPRDGTALDGAAPCTGAWRRISALRTPRAGQRTTLW